LTLPLPLLLLLLLLLAPVAKLCQSRTLSSCISQVYYGFWQSLASERDTHQMTGSLLLLTMLNQQFIGLERLEQKWHPSDDINGWGLITNLAKLLLNAHVVSPPRGVFLCQVRVV
jgi:hypothetical protein